MVGPEVHGPDAHRGRSGRLLVALRETGRVTKKPAPPNQGLAAACLLLTLTGSAWVILTESVSWPLVLSIPGVAAVLVGIIGLCFFVYRGSRRMGDGFFKALGRTIRAAIMLIIDLP